nr:restriction endonuclease subunit S [Microbacterium esteraromaticum]
MKWVVSYNDDSLPESTDDSTQIRYVEISDVNETDGITGAADVVFGEAPSRARRILRRGDVIVSTVRTYLRAVAAVGASYDGAICSTGFAVLRACGVDERFLKYAVLDRAFMDQVVAQSTGVSYPAINASDLVRIRIPLPAPSEQRAIADYLDRETAQIDAFIAKNEELITLLTERRLALIARAAFRGLDPAVSTRHSGIEWLGEVPIHWETSRLSRWFGVVLGKMLDASKFAATEGHYLPYVRAANVKQGRLDLSDFKSMPFTAGEQLKLDLRGGDLVVVEGGASYGVSAYVSEDMAGWAFQKTVNRVRARGGHSTQFLGYQLEVLRCAGVLGMLADASTIPHLTAEKLERLSIAMPPISEQFSVVEYVEQRTRTLQSAIETAELGVVLARERRAALISAAVTGKIEVPAA